MRKKGKQVLAALMGVFLFAQTAAGTGLFNEYPGKVYAETGRSAIVNATTLNVRSGPGTGNSIVKKLSYGTDVTVTGETTDSEGTVWYKIQFTSGQSTAEGYASSEFIKFPVTYKTDAEFETYLNQQGFPESYKDSLRTLHAEYPSWVFQVQNTGLDWNDVIQNESMVGSNLVSSSSISSWKSTEYGAYDWNTGKWTGFDGDGWVAASSDIVSYYMDPRNFLNEIYVFQFLLHTYDSAHQTREGLQSLIEGTFLENAAVSAGDGGSDSQENTVSEPGTSDTGNGSGTLLPGQNYGPGMETSAVTSRTSESVSTDGPGTADTESSASGGSSQGDGMSGGLSQGESTAGSQQDVSLEGPSATVSARTTQVLALPSVEYGPGMDASVITGDTTGESTTSPVPSGQSYVDIIMNAAAQSGVNPYVIGAMILQEQGKGTSGIISGKTAGYEGYYNFFNIGAYETDTMSAVTRGLWYASQSGSYGRPWNSIEKSIVGGATYYGENFVSQGQDTFYLKKFNVQGNNIYKHQYMTNVEGAAGEGAKLSRAYTDEMKKEALIFKIPVFNNMPETACAKPTASGSPNNKLSSLEVEGYALTPTFSRDVESYDVIVNPSVSQISVKASVIDSKATVSGTGTVSLANGNNTIQVEVKAENGSVRTYMLNVVRQSDAPVVNVPVSGNGSSDTGSSGSVGATGGPGTEVGPGGILPDSASGNQSVTLNLESQAGTSGQESQSEANSGTGQSQDVQVGAAPS